MISFACPQCRMPYNVPDATAGRQTRCRKCRQMFVVPGVPRAQKGRSRQTILLLIVLFVAMASFGAGIWATLKFQSWHDGAAITAAPSPPATTNAAVPSTTGPKVTGPAQSEPNQSVPKQPERQQPEPKKELTRAAVEEAIRKRASEDTRKENKQYEELVIVSVSKAVPFTVIDRDGTYALQLDEERRQKRILRQAVFVAVQYKQFPDKETFTTGMVLMRGRIVGRPIIYGEVTNKQVAERIPEAEFPKTEEDALTILRSAAGLDGFGLPEPKDCE